MVGHISKGDLIISSVRPNLKSFGYIDFNPIRTIVSTGFMVVTPLPEIEGLYVYHLFFNHILYSSIESKRQQRIKFNKNMCIINYY